MSVDEQDPRWRERQVWEEAMGADAAVLAEPSLQVAARMLREASKVDCDPHVARPGDLEGEGPPYCANCSRLLWIAIPPGHFTEFLEPED